MANEKAYHVSINGKGYILLDESYAVQPQRPFNPRFSTGDPGFGDLSFWQFFAQDGFEDGMGQEVFDAVKKYFHAMGFDTRSGKAKLGPALEVVANFGGSGAPQKTAANLLNGTNAFTSRKQYHYPKVIEFNGDIYVCFYHSNANDGVGAPIAAFTRTSVVSQSTSGRGTPQIYILNCSDAFVMRRDSTASATSAKEHLIMVHDKVLSVVDQDFSAVTTVALTACGISVRQTTTDGVIVVEELTDSGSIKNQGHPLVIEKIFFNAGAWTVKTQANTVTDLIGGTPNNTALDSNGTLYILALKLTLGNQHTSPSLIRIVAEDLTSTTVTITSVDQLPSGFIPCNIFGLNGQVYMCGNLMETSSEGRRAIIKFPNVTVWKSPVIRAENYGTTNGYFVQGFGVQHFPVHVGLDKVLFFGDCPGNVKVGRVCEMDLNEVVRDYMAIPAGVLALGVAYPGGVTPSEGNAWWMDPHCHALYKINGVAYIFDMGMVNGDIYREKTSEVGGNIRGGHGLLTTSSKGPASMPSELTLKLSDFGGNTPLIQKTLFSVSIELSQAIPAGYYLDVYINGVSFGRMTDSDGTVLEMKAAAETTGTKFAVELRVPSDMAWGGELVRVAIKYIPTQFKKRAWGMAVRLQNKMRLLNGSLEQRTPMEMLADLTAAWAANVPVKFVDVDGTEYDVIMTEWKGRQPLTADKRDEREYLAPLELLEV